MADQDLVPFWKVREALFIFRAGGSVTHHVRSIGASLVTASFWVEVAGRVRACVVDVMGEVFANQGPVGVDPEEDGVGEQKEHPPPAREQFIVIFNPDHLRWMKKESLTRDHFSRMKIAMAGCWINPFSAS